MRSRWILSTAALIGVTVAVACGGGSDNGPTVTGVTPGITAPQASPTPLVLTPPPDFLQFLGETIAFAYPPEWYLWNTSYEAEQETVVMANITEEEGEEGLPSGAIKIEFTGKPAEPLEPLPGEVIEEFIITGVTFTLREGEEVPWTLRGAFTIGGINFRYVADVQMNTTEPPMDLLRPILDSWVVGSTNNHPTRTCISPGECP